MSFLDDPGCAYCSAEPDEVAATYDGRCPLCGAQLVPDAPDCDEPSPIRASADFPGWSKRGNPRDPSPPLDDRRTE